MNEQSKAQGQGFWKEHFASWKASGLTQQAYCLREGISYQSFVYQNNRANTKVKMTPVNFIEAKVEPMSVSTSVPGLSVLLPNGVRIGIEGEITAVVLQTIFSCAGGISC